MGVESLLAEAIEGLEAARQDPGVSDAFEGIVALAVRALAGDGRVLVCGNGGSMTDAMHFAAELVGRLRETRPALSALALSDPATLTCIANDFGFEEVFARQIEAQGRPDDLLLVLSTSGISGNVIRAVDTARARGLSTAALLGRGGGGVAGRVDVPLIVPKAATADRVQEVHAVLLHGLAAAIEHRLSAR